jgi:hypothetical protein
MKYFKKVIVTIFLIAASVACFIIPNKTINQTEFQVSEKLKQIKISEKNGLKNLLEYVGLFFLVIAVWQWRKEFGFDSFGFISRHPEISGTNPENRDSDENDIPPRPPSSPLGSRIHEFKTSESGEFENFEIQEKINEIIAILNQNPNAITNATIISRKLGVSRQTAERYLFELLKNNLLRKDTYPGSMSSVYSLVNSTDNRAIDFFIQEIIPKDEKVISDYRYVRLRSRYEIDAIIKTEKTNYIVELKYSKTESDILLNRGIEQLILIEEQIKIEPIELILIIVTLKLKNKISEVKEFTGKRNLKVYRINEDLITSPKTR